ncbi:uncharacterized protein METZ01_LOCUS344301 [marine metagenome]|uniref:Uncharacterized protein n=1 Tax=marine metagenome TaxID=408172 RepID=A0A382R2J8_9ZZZZ
MDPYDLDVLCVQRTASILWISSGRIGGKKLRFIFESFNPFIFSI